MFLAIIALVEMGEVKFNFDYALDNLSAPPIIDIKAFSGDNYRETCPDNYLPMFNFHWSGTIEGCDCNDNISKNRCGK
jgi:hypothetical protein